jgi:formylmethanofuran dehydrogenase subunit D
MYFILFGLRFYFMVVEVILISGRTSQQGIGLETGKGSRQYFESTSYIELSPDDVDVLGAEDGHTVKVSTDHGSIVVSVNRSESLEEGLCFFPYGPWANRVFGSDTSGTGMPLFKGIKATVESAKGETILSLSELVDELRRDT